MERRCEERGERRGSGEERRREERGGEGRKGEGGGLGGGRLIRVYVCGGQGAEAPVISGAGAGAGRGGKGFRLQGAGVSKGFRGISP